MLLNNCTINFDHDGVFFCGESVSGSVSLKVEKKKICKALVLEICGVANVKWRGAGESDFEQNDICFQTNINLLAGDISVLNDENIFPFNFNLPNNLPASFEGSFGFVRYVATVIQSDNTSDLSYKLPFVVISDANLNLYPKLSIPMDKIISKNFSNKVLTLKIELPKSGYVPGEDIPITCHADNKGKVQVSKIKYTLVRYTTFQVKSPNPTKRIDIFRVASCVGEGIGSNDKKSTKLFMPIPSSTPSSLSTDSIITIEYTLKVKAKFSGMNGDGRCQMPIIIGTIPFVKDSESKQLLARPAYEKFAPPTYDNIFNEVNEEPAENTQTSDPSEMTLKNLITTLRTCVLSPARKQTRNLFRNRNSKLFKWFRNTISSLTSSPPMNSTLNENSDHEPDSIDLDANVNDSNSISEPNPNSESNNDFNEVVDSNSNFELDPNEKSDNESNIDADSESELKTDFDYELNPISESDNEPHVESERESESNADIGSDAESHSNSEHNPNPESDNKSKPESDADSN